MTKKSKNDHKTPSGSSPKKRGAGRQAPTPAADLPEGERQDTARTGPADGPPITPAEAPVLGSPAELAAGGPRLRLEYREPAELADNPKNWRKHPPAQTAALRDLLSEVGWAGAVLFNERTGRLIDGHARAKLARKAKSGPIPVLVGEWSEADEAKILATLDPVASMAEADSEAVAKLLREISTESEPIKELLASLHLSSGAVGRADASVDAEAEDEGSRPAELMAKWGTGLGQVWELGSHRVRCGDSTEPDDVRELMAGELADVVFTDPPYGVNIQGGLQNTTIAGDLTSTAIPFAFANAVELATVPGARLYFCGGEANLPLYQKLFEKYCRQLPRHLIWIKEHFVMKPNGYHCQYEMIFHGYKQGGGGLSNWYAGRSGDEASDVWQISRDPSAEYVHPTQKPTAIPARGIANSCPPGGRVYEPFGGSGSTLIACEQLGRKCFLMELAPEYVAVILERWHNATGKTPELISGTKPTAQLPTGQRGNRKRGKR